MSKIEAIARDMAESAMRYKLPYSFLKGAAKDSVFVWRYSDATPSELIQAQIAAVNILKNRGVENPKRKPLSSLPPKERQRMRLIAKQYAATLQKMLPNMDVYVDKRPIKHLRGRDYLCVVIDRKDGISLFDYPSYEHLLAWEALAADRQALLAAQISENFKTRDEKIASKQEVIKANLEDLFDRTAAERPRDTPSLDCSGGKFRSIDEQLDLDLGI